MVHATEAEMKAISEAALELRQKLLDDCMADMEKGTYPDHNFALKVYLSACRMFTDSVEAFVKKHGGKMIEYRYDPAPVDEEKVS